MDVPSRHELLDVKANLRAEVHLRAVLKPQYSVLFIAQGPNPGQRNIGQPPSDLP